MVAGEEPLFSTQLERLAVRVVFCMLHNSAARESFDRCDGNGVVLAFDVAVTGALIHRGFGDDDAHDRRARVEKLRGVGGRALPQQFEEGV